MAASLSGPELFQLLLAWETHFLGVQDDDGKDGFPEPHCHGENCGVRRVAPWDIDGPHCLLVKAGAGGGSQAGFEEMVGKLHDLPRSL